eukprot:3432882-Amphidinium_carterae.1
MFRAARALCILAAPALTGRVLEFLRRKYSEKRLVPAPPDDLAICNIFTAFQIAANPGVMVLGH